jgi:hypothetical protein
MSSTSLFQGSPLQSSQYVSTVTDQPKWLQDAIYQQIQAAQNAASIPYQQYDMPTVAELSPDQQKAYQNIESNQGAWQPALSQAQSGMSTLAANPNAATNAAQPYMQKAGQTSTENIQQYMNPYQQNVMDVIARQGARNLQENILPGVSDAFIRAGSFGGTRMADMGQRAVRDTQDSILNQQAQLAQQGYGQALGASQADLARQASLAGEAGNLASTDVNNQQGTLGKIAALAQQQQGMSTADAQALEAAGQAQQQNTQAQLTAAQQQYLDEQNYTRNMLDWSNNQIRGMAPSVPTATSQTSVGSGQTYSPSPLSQVATGLSVYKALNG